MHRKFATLTLTALACAMVASAQTSSTSGAIRGVIKDKAGKAVSGATVLLRNRETGSPGPRPPMPRASTALACCPWATTSSP